MRGSLVVTFVAIRLPRSEVQIPVRAEILMEISASCTVALPKNPTTGTKKAPVSVPSSDKKGGLVVWCR